MIKAPSRGLWLSLFFWFALRAPRVPRLLRPVILAGAWRFCARLRDATTTNAVRILGPGSSMEDRAALGRAVLASFFDCVLGLSDNRRSAQVPIASVDGIDSYRHARAMGRGAILVTAHLGPFERAVAGLRDLEPRIHIAFRRDPCASFERLRSIHHRRLEITEAPLDDGLPAWLGLRDALSADGVVLVQGDRVMPGQKGVPIQFLGGHMEIPDGPVRLALATGAPLVPIFALRAPSGGARILIHEPILVGYGGPPETLPDEALQRVAAAIASIVQQYPEQWLVLERAWIEDRSDA